MAALAPRHCSHRSAPELGAAGGVLASKSADVNNAAGAAHTYLEAGSLMLARGGVCVFDDTDGQAACY